MNHVVCLVCGRRWTAAIQLRHCRDEACEASWLDLPMFTDKADADRASAEARLEARRTAAT